jgi:hypothetical protein
LGAGPSTVRDVGSLLSLSYPNCPRTNIYPLKQEVDSHTGRPSPCTALGIPVGRRPCALLGTLFVRPVRSLPPQQALQIVPKSMRPGCVALPTYALCAVGLSTLRPRVAEQVKETDGNAKPFKLTDSFAKRPSRRPVEDDWAAGSRICVPLPYRSPRSLLVTGWCTSAQVVQMEVIAWLSHPSQERQTVRNPLPTCLRLLAHFSNDSHQPGLGGPSALP